MYEPFRSFIHSFIHSFFPLAYHSIVPSYCNLLLLAHVEWGTMGNQGKRSDLEDAAKICVQEGYQKVAEEYPILYIRYYKGFRELNYQHNISMLQNPMRGIKVILF